MSEWQAVALRQLWLTIVRSSPARSVFSVSVRHTDTYEQYQLYATLFQRDRFGPPSKKD